MYYNIQTSCTPHYENEDTPFEIPKSWEWTNIKEISSSILYGVSESAKQKGEYRLLRITDIQDDKVNWSEVPYTDYDERKVHDYILLENDIVFARTGATVGKSYIVRDLHEKAIYASYLIRVRTSKEIIPKYIKYFFESGYYWDQICMSSVGIGQPNVNGTSLGNLNIPLPPLAEQSRIVAEIERCFALIDTLESNKHDLQEAIKQAKSKALDLAIHGKLVSQDPNDEPASELLKRINPNAAICDISHYGNLPTNWSISTMSNLCRIIDGEKQSNINRIYLDVKYLRGKSDGEYLMSGKFVPANSTMILVDGENSGEIFTTTIDGYQGSTFKILDISEEMYKPFVLYVILSYQKQLRENKVGSAIPHLNKKLFREIVVEVPPYEEQKRIVNKIDELFSFIDSILLEL